MSVIQKVLEDLGKFLVEKDEYFDNKEFYFDVSQVSNSNDLPCFCFDTLETQDNLNKAPLSPDCRTKLKQVEILALTDTTDSALLIKELWDYEEKLICTLRGVLPQDINDNLMNIEFVSTSKIGSVFRKIEGADKPEFFCNALCVIYELEYAI